ncbi:MAG: hypothetical protein HY716_01635 [Planctomycetes bacterium]|nr:hypothetical protein [Planctomycetota bacterium]
MTATIAIAFAILATGAAPWHGQNDKQELGRAVRKTESLDSYLFAERLALEGGPAPGAFEVTGLFDREVGWRCDVERLGRVYRFDKKIVMKHPEKGAWTLVAPGRSIDDGPGGVQMTAAARNLVPPHEQFRRLEERFRTIRKKTETEKIAGKDCAVYHGDLAEDAARDFIPPGVRRLMNHGRVTGDASAWVNPDGVVVRLRVHIEIQIASSDPPVRISAPRTWELSSPDQAKLDIPAEVQKLLETPQDDPTKKK